MSDVLDAPLAARFSEIALGHVVREYPNKLDHVVTGPDDLLGPRALHPIFYGSFDWHSCVHGYWLVSRLLRTVPDLANAPRIIATIDAHVTRENVAAEIAYLERPMQGTFERPYGWAWLLALAAELARHTTAHGRRWSVALAPLASAFARRFTAYLPRATYPVRAGTHANSAFALALAYDYAIVGSDEALATAVRDTAHTWYAHDACAQAWEPSGEDFLSPVLMEAECMRRVMAPTDFARWLRRFLPSLAAGEPATLFTPATVSDRSDGRIVHLDGLNLSRSWCLRAIASSFDADDARRAPVLRSARAHLDASLAHVGGDYMGEHWLATFALLALEECGTDASAAADPERAEGA